MAATHQLMKRETADAPVADFVIGDLVHYRV
jgi:hypothetical protein